MISMSIDKKLTHKVALIYSCKELMKIREEFGQLSLKEPIRFQIFAGSIVESDLDQARCQIQVGFGRIVQ